MRNNHTKDEVRIYTEQRRSAIDATKIEKTTISARIPTTTYRKLALLALDQRRDKQDIVTEALEKFFRGRDIPGA